MPASFHDAIFLIKTRYLFDKFFTGPFQSSVAALRLEVYFIIFLSFFFFLLLTEQAANKIRGEKKL